MDYRTLGHSGIRVSALSLGSWMTYESMAEPEARAVLTAGLDAGITFLDDARYDDRTGTLPMKTGYSEVLFGRMLRDTRHPRAGLVIANKLWFEFFPHESIEAELDGSLARLQMDYLDIEFCAGPPPGLPMLDLVRELDRLVASGKLRAWGVLNWPVEMIEEAVQVAAVNGLRRPTAAQLAYSVLTRSPVEDPRMEAVCDNAGIAVVASYSLNGGLLSGKYRGADGAPGGRLADQLESPRVRPLLPKIDPFLEIAREAGCSPSQLALAYCLKNPRVSSLLFGARSPAQVRDNAGALAVVPQLTGAVVAALRNL